ncbi:MAG: hypothetical protein JWQ21_2173 [Herminiimonas sp.]|nr:hypothetical protein [Herminiimonas sp.]
MFLRKRVAVDRDPSNARSLKTAFSGVTFQRAGTHSLGAQAIGAVAFGALAMGVVAIGRLAIGRARIRRLEIDEIVVHRLRVMQPLKTSSAA